MSETEINFEILIAVSRLPDILCWRNNSGLLFTPTGKRVRSGVKGSPDIIAVYRGRFIGFEVKTETGKQSLPQKRFQAACERAGGIYAIVRSAEDALSILETA